MFIRCVLLYLSGRQLDVSCGGCFKCMLLWYSVWMVWAVSLCLNSLFLSVSAQVPLSLISLEPLDQLSAPLADLNPVCDCQELVYDIMWLVQWGSSDMSSCLLEDSFLLRNSFSSCISSCESAVGGVSCSCSFSASVILSGARADVVISYQDWSLLDASVGCPCTSSWAPMSCFRCSWVCCWHGVPFFVWVQFHCDAECLPLPVLGLRFWG